MSISTLIRMFVVILVLSLLSGAFAESLLLSTSSSNPTLNIPRWKMYSNPQDPNEVWLLIADNHDQFFKSSDGGANWVAFDDTAANTYDAEHGGEVNSWIDYHSSLTGNGRDLWVTYPDGGGIYLNKISAPANDSSDIASQIHVATDGSRAKRSNVVATENEVFVITRTSNYAGGNVRYHRYNHSGTLLSSGYVADLSDTNVRIGATLDALGQPVVVIWCDGARLEYHRWNGSSFTAPADGLIWDSDDANGCDASSLTREYAFSIT